MKKNIKKILIKILQPLIIKLGFVKKESITRELGKNSLLYTFYENLKTIGFVPKHIIDVGANHGTWTRETLKHFPDAYYTLIEPQSRLSESFKDILLSNKKVSFHAVGAGSVAGSFKFTLVNRDDSCTFRYTQEEAKLNGYEQIEIPVITLNDFLGSNTSNPIPDLIKIDAEGMDIDVLKGASDFFGKTEIFMVEVGIVNKDFTNSFLAMTQFMDNNGYRLFEITDINRPFVPRVLWLMELVFIKKNGIIDSFKVDFKI